MNRVVWAIVLLISLWLTWPLALLEMPASADHLVHLTRIQQYADVLQTFELTAWRSTWFFGSPVGELYPPLGDLLVITVRLISFTLLSWSQAYAIAFFCVFTLQAAVVIRLVNLVSLHQGWHINAGWLGAFGAACFFLMDPGFAREGGWLYTVWFGVWPQALATSLVWLGFAELGRFFSEHPGHYRRRAALAFAAGLLAHPMALPMLAFGAPLWWALAVCGQKEQWRQATFAILWTAALAGSLALWWYWPMMAHRHWMASYGWLYHSLAAMVEHALQGHLSYRMPMAVSVLTIAGLLVALVRGGLLLRFVAAFAFAQWAMASADFYWDLRLGRLSDGFHHIQYQRFIIAAKPGFFALAGIVIAYSAHAVGQAYKTSRFRGAGMATVTAVCVFVVGSNVIADASKYEVGSLDTNRLHLQPEFEHDYQRLLTWLNEQPEHGRVVFDDLRDLHWFMDATGHTGRNVYKVGFTPGDNFVHKPESKHPALLDRLNAQYLVSRRSAADSATQEANPPPASAIASFGTIDVTPIDSYDASQPSFGKSNAHIEGSPDNGAFNINVEALEAGDTLTLPLSGYPRWVFHQNGKLLPWTEVPVFGNGPNTTPEERRNGKLRGGRAWGDTGREPTLIQLTLDSNEVIQAEYRSGQWFDWLSRSWSLCTLIFLVAYSLFSPTKKLCLGIEVFVSRRLRPTMVAAIPLLLVCGLGSKWMAERRNEQRTAVGWAEQHIARLSKLRVAPVKADMLIRPAIAKFNRSPSAYIEFSKVRLGSSLIGWVALDDDHAKGQPGGSHTFRILVRERSKPKMPWDELHKRKLRHHPGRAILNLDTSEYEGVAVDLRVQIESSGDRPPPVGFDLELPDWELR